VFKDQKFFITAHNFGDIHLRKLVELKNSDGYVADAGIKITADGTVVVADGGSSGVNTKDAN
jgi:hypothetical protein